MKTKPLFEVIKVFTGCLLMLVFFACSTGSSTVPEVTEEEGNTILKAANVRPLKDVKYELTPGRIAKGKYLTEGILWCFNCHTERDTTQAGWPPKWEKKGSGTIRWKTDSTYLYAPNITPDEKTGIGNFTDDMIARAIREGVGHDDRALESMPWGSFRELTDEDVASVVSYLRTIPAIENRVPRRKLSLSGEEDLKEGALPLTQEIGALDFSDPLTRGKYLISIADCIGCHTAWYGRNPGILGGGNPMSKNTEQIFSTNITSDATGVGAWSEETFIYVMKNGKGKSGPMNQRMPWASFKNMTDEDLSSIYQALMTTYPVKHSVQNGVVPSPCEVCGMKHGSGDKNKIEPLKMYEGNTKIPTDVTGIYVGQLFPDTLSIIQIEGKLILRAFEEEWRLSLINSAEYFADGLLAPLHFVRDKHDIVIELQFNDLGRSFTKVGKPSISK